MELAGAILAIGDDALEFFHTTVSAAEILLGDGFAWSIPPDLGFFLFTVENIALGKFLK